MVKPDDVIRIATAVYLIYLESHLKSGHQLSSGHLYHKLKSFAGHKASHGLDFKQMGEGGPF